MHRADVGNVRVHRGEEAERVAADANARAVTRGGEVFIPDSAGTLDSGAGRGLLAHELTHVIQQRRLGTSVPLEHSPAGRRLESEACDDRASRPRRSQARPRHHPPRHRPPRRRPAATTPAPAADDDDARSTARDIQEELIASGRAFRMPDGSIVFPGSGMHLPEQRPSQTQAAVAMQRAPDDRGADARRRRPHRTRRLLHATVRHRVLPMPETPAAGATPTPATGAPAPAQTPPLHVRGSPRRPPATPAAATAPAQAAAPAPALEPAPPIDLDDLARRVYGQVRTQLRSELLIDRERAGLLTDFR